MPMREKNKILNEIKKNVFKHVINIDMRRLNKRTFGSYDSEHMTLILTTSCER